MQATRQSSWLLVLSILGGVLLVTIGVRYLLLPGSAARTFGLPGRPTGFELHYVVGLRDIWLGVLAVGFAVLRQWQALALWFAIGAITCFGDAYIAGTSAGRAPHIGFHVACGLACTGLAFAGWRLSVQKS